MRTPAPLVLIVDHCEDQQAILRATLNFLAYRIEVAKDGHEAVEMAKRLSPDVVLMDLSMPKQNGFVATRRLRNDPRTKHLPIIALTACGIVEYGLLAQEAGFDRFLQKPVHSVTLLAEVRIAICRARKPDLS